MRNHFVNLKNVNCAYSVFLTKLSSANKREEQSDERFKPTSYEQRWDMSGKCSYTKHQLKTIQKIEQKL